MDAHYLVVVSVGVNKIAVVSTSVRTYMCACNGGLDIMRIVVSKHDIARNTGLDLKLARLAVKGNGAVARAAGKSASGGTLLSLGDSRLISRTHWTQQYCRP